MSELWKINPSRGKVLRILWAYHWSSEIQVHPGCAQARQQGHPPEVRQSAASQVTGGSQSLPQLWETKPPGREILCQLWKTTLRCRAAACPAPQTPPPAAAPKRGRSRVVTIGFLVGVVTIVCVSLFGIAWGFGWLEGIFPSDTTPTAEDTTEEPLVAEDGLTPSLTEEPEQIQTETSEPTQMDTDTPTITPSPTETSTPTLTSTPTAGNSISSMISQGAWKSGKPGKIDQYHRSSQLKQFWERFLT